VDAQTGLGLPGASIVVTSTEQGVLSGIDGRYLLTSVPAGVVAVRVESIGYGAKTVTDVQVPSDGVTELNITLDPQAVELDGIRVTAAAERGSVSRALDEQRNASGIVSALSSEQIARSPDGDAAAAMRRVSGVTVQDGKFVFVRGLGERYTTTSLNGARVPSPEPERKVVPLDMIPSSLIESITTSKTYTPDQAGDFSGASVDIRTREFPGRGQVSLSVTSGANTAAARSAVPAAPTTGGEWLALGGGDRAIPAPVGNAGDLQQALPQAAVNQMVGSYRPSWTARERSVMPNMSFGMSGGGAGSIFGQRIGVLLSGTYSISQEVQADQVRGVAIAGAEPGTTLQADHYAGTTGRTSVLWGGILNPSTTLGSGTRLTLDNAYNRTADNDARHETGTSENLGLNLAIDRLRYVERAIRSTQLAGVHQVGAQSRFDWSATTSGVIRKEPDRSEIVYARADAVDTWRWLSGSNEGAVRTFADLGESSLEGGANVTLGLGTTASSPTLKFGGLIRHTERDAVTSAYSLSAPTLPAEERALTPEEIFDG